MSEEKLPPQSQNHQPGLESEMKPRPLSGDNPAYRAAGKLEGKVALISGGDSGIGRAVAVLFAREGADVAIVYLEENSDAQETQKMVEDYGRRCLLIPGDAGYEEFCESAVEKTFREYSRLDILVNNASEQHPQDRLEDISAEQLERTFRTNVFSYFYLTKHALKHLGEGASIINTTSITAYRGSDWLLDYSATKGAELAFTRSLSQNLAERKIRVNAVAPGPIWTPLIPATFPPEDIEDFGTDTALGRVGQPFEVATCYVFLASDDASYITGQTLHPNGGEIING